MIVLILTYVLHLLQLVILYLYSQFIISFSLIVCVLLVCYKGINWATSFCCDNCTKLSGVKRYYICIFSIFIVRSIIFEAQKKKKIQLCELIVVVYLARKIPITYLYTHKPKKKKKKRS